MTLFEGECGSEYMVEGLFVEAALTRRLEALGLNDGTHLSVLNRKRNGAMIIKVRGTRLAIGKHISSYIEVVPVKEEPEESHVSEVEIESKDMPKTDIETQKKLTEKTVLQRDEIEESLQRENSGGRKDA